MQKSTSTKIPHCNFHIKNTHDATLAQQYWHQVSYTTCFQDQVVMVHCCCRWLIPIWCCPNCHYSIDLVMNNCNDNKISGADIPDMNRDMSNTMLSRYLDYTGVLYKPIFKSEGYPRKVVVGLCGLCTKIKSQ